MDTGNSQTVISKIHREVAPSTYLYVSKNNSTQRCSYQACALLLMTLVSVYLRPMLYLLTLLADSISAGNHCFAFRNVDIVDIVKALGLVSSNAIGPDLLPLVFIILFDLFNRIITLPEFPLLWKRAKVFPI